MLRVELTNISSQKAQSTDDKKGGKEGEIIHKCSDILEGFKSLPDIIRPEQQYESVFMKKQMDLGVPQENSRNPAVMCGVSGHVKKPNPRTRTRFV